MPRDCQKFLRGERVMVPRWLFLAVIWGGVLWIGLKIFVPPSWVIQQLDSPLWIGMKIFVPPSWVIQQLDSPDGNRSARLLRSQYLRQNFVVRLKEGTLWHTAYYSNSITNDFRVDLGERMVWSPDSSRVFFRLDGKLVWGYDFTLARDLRRDELASVSEL
jgi:hypothetical protein